MRVFLAELIRLAVAAAHMSLPARIIGSLPGVALAPTIGIGLIRTLAIKNGSEQTIIDGSSHLNRYCNCWVGAVSNGKHAIRRRTGSLFAFK